MGYLDNYKSDEEIRKMFEERDKKLRKKFKNKKKALNKNKSIIKSKKKKKKLAKRLKHNNCPQDYRIYISSKWWTDRKTLYYKYHAKKCAVCESTKYIQLHHMTYKDYGHEKDEHLVALCRGCHEEFHTINKWHWNLVDATNKFIIEKRESFEFPVV